MPIIRTTFEWSLDAGEGCRETCASARPLRSRRWTDEL